MRYNNRDEVERIGRAGSVYEYDEVFKARVLSSFWLYCDPHDLGFSPHMTTRREGFWESWITLWMSQNVAPGSRCIDVGANQGYYTMFLAEHRCAVTAVEPQHDLVGLIVRSAKENGFDNVRVDWNAISDTTGEMTLRVPTGHGMNASLAYEPLSPNGYTEVAVPVYRLDDYCEGTQYYDFIKVDVEGAEAQVFRGAQRFIEENPKCVWLLEWRWDRLDDPEASAQELFDVFDVWYVDFHGRENQLSTPEALATRQNEDWMLVLRKKN